MATPNIVLKMTFEKQKFVPCLHRIKPCGNHRIDWKHSSILRIGKWPASCPRRFTSEKESLVLSASAMQAANFSATPAGIYQTTRNDILEDSALQIYTALQEIQNLHL